MPSLHFFDYPSYMSELTAHQQKRIRRADAGDIERMANQEKYWSEASLHEILKRIERLNNEDPSAAQKASSSALKILDRGRGFSPNLKALTLAVHGSTQRSNGNPAAALTIYEQALAIPGLSRAGRGDVLTRMAPTQVFLGHMSQGLKTINLALGLVADPVPTLVVRGWILMLIGSLKEALADFTSVMELVQNSPRSDYSLLCAIVNCCNILSFESSSLSDSLLDRIQAAIADYRRLLPNSGSGFYRVQRPRLMLSRAEALILIRVGKEEQAFMPLQRAAQGLRGFPDDGLAAHADLMCLLGKLGRESEAAKVAASAAELLDRVSYRISPFAKKTFLEASKKTTISFGEAVELRSMLRPQNTS